MSDQFTLDALQDLVCDPKVSNDAKRIAIRVAYCTGRGDIAREAVEKAAQRLAERVPA